MEPKTLLQTASESPSGSPTRQLLLLLRWWCWWPSRWLTLILAACGLVQIQLNPTLASLTVKNLSMSGTTDDHAATSNASAVSAATADTLAQFMRRRERVYSRRRLKIASACARLKVPKFCYGSRVGHEVSAMLFERNYSKVAYCQIPKVASSTWTTNMLRLGHRRHNPTGMNHLEASRVFGLSNGENPVELMSSMKNSLVIVRHPLSRLVSAYYSKFVAMGVGGPWDKIRRYVIQRFRRKGPKVLRGMPQESRSKFLPATEAAGAVATNGTRWQPDGIDLEDSRIPTPDEYLRYVLEQLNYDVVDNHFRPQFLTCPFCELNFTIYSKIEELSEDTAYFFLRNPELRDLISSKEHLNMTREPNPERLHRRFWKKVARPLLGSAIRAYEEDFDMFDYSANDYLNKLGIKLGGRKF